MIHITERVLSITPYISTTWENILSLRIQRAEGVFHPTLIIQLHNRTEIEIPNLPAPIIHQIVQAHGQFLDTTFHKAIAGLSMEEILAPPPSPFALLEKFASLMEQFATPPAEENEEVSEEDLRFSDWQVKEIEKNLYSVTHPLSPSEEYRVCLKEPIGCTCGHTNCEHIVAALKS
jgi:hypothetical protein